MASSPSDNIFNFIFHLLFFFFFNFILFSFFHFQFIFQSSSILNFNQNPQYKGKLQCTHYTWWPIIAQQCNHLTIDCDNDISNCSYYFFNFLSQINFRMSQWPGSKLMARPSRSRFELLEGVLPQKPTSWRKIFRLKTCPRENNLWSHVVRTPVAISIPRLIACYEFLF